MNPITVQWIAGLAILFLGRELSFLFSAAMAAFIGTRLTHLLPAAWPAWADPVFLAALALLAAALTLVDKGTGFYVTGFLVGGFVFNEYFSPGGTTIPILPFVVGSVLGAIIVGLLGEWAMIVVSCLIGTYLIYNVLPIFGTARTLASGALFVIGGLAQVTMFQMQKHSDR